MLSNAEILKLESEKNQYPKFLETKRVLIPNSGPNIQKDQVHSKLFPFQRDIVPWAIRKARAAVFADTGLGKTFIQLEWSRLITKKNRLIVAPLSIARQTVDLAKDIGIDVKYSPDGKAYPFTITNYERIYRFNPKEFESVVLDESSLLKGLDGKTRKKLNLLFRDTPYRLCCTATPAPNDITEIANHAEFLGIMTRVDLLATFFTHDDNGWRLKKHAEIPFYEWLASWGMAIRTPSDLGYSDEGYILQKLTVTPLWVETKLRPKGQLFWNGLNGIVDRSRVRKGTLDERITAAANLINSKPGQWIVWTGLNEESEKLASLISDAKEISGQTHVDEKVRLIEAFQDRKFRVLVTKPKIAGFGMNFQNCHQMVFVGLSDSWEAYYQCIRRCYRFGQKHPVSVYIVLSEAERAIYQNVQRKEKEADEMTSKLIANAKEFEKAELAGKRVQFEYKTRTEKGKNWTTTLGDSAEAISQVPDLSIDLSVFSPPFLSLYTYSPTERDLGNSKDEATFFQHFDFIIRGLHRITKPGRNCCCHVAQVPAMLVRDGYIGMKDFRGKTIMAFEAAGWIYHGEVLIDKDPQVQAIRTHSKALLFVQLAKDSSWLRPANADYILVFRKPGDNAVPIKPDLTQEEWIEWARPVWYNIRESNTLNAAEGRDEKDERHIAPLQLEVIERCIRLWSNPKETVFSPFAGIGSEGFKALQLNRKFRGIELKPSYFEAMLKNLHRAEQGFRAKRDSAPNKKPLFKSRVK